MFIFEIVAVLAAIGAGLLFLSGFASAAESAPALAALAATSLVIAGIPYFFVSILQRRELRRDIDRLSRSREPTASE